MCRRSAMRFVAETLCAELTPPCGHVEGACCYEAAPCEITTRRACLLRLGDMNCDSVVNFSDVDAFITALLSKSAYYEEHADCNWYNGDLDGNDIVNFSDVDGFVEVLISGGYGEITGTWLGANTPCDMCP